MTEGTTDRCHSANFTSHSGWVKVPLVALLTYHLKKIILNRSLKYVNVMPLVGKNTKIIVGHMLLLKSFNNSYIP